MRVLQVYSGNLYGGVETFLLTLARHRNVCPRMESHFAFCFEGRVSGELREAGAAVHLLGSVQIRRPWTVWMARRRLKALLRVEQFDVAICHSVWSQAIFGPVVRQAGLPLVFWLHDATNGRHWLERWASRTSPDLAICNSRFTAEQLPALYRAAPSAVVYCPVLLPGVPNSDRERQQTRLELETPPDATVLIQTSRMEEWKGHRLHLEALRALRKRQDWMCWFAGGAQRPKEREYLNGLRREAEQWGLARRVRFLGQRTDVPRLLAAADIHCQPNLGPEPFGLAFVEALQAGLPVVTTAIGGAREIVDASCGVLVPANDASALAAALERLMEQPQTRRRMGEAGRRRGREMFGPQAQLPRVHQLLEQVVHG